MVNIFSKLNKDNTKDTDLTYGKLVSFFVPLALSTLSITLSNLLLTRALGYFPNSEMYISSFSVPRNLGMLLQFPIAALTLTMTSFITSKQTYQKIKKYALALIIIISIWLISIAYTPIGEIILSKYYHLDGELLENAIISLKITIFFPILISVRSYFLGIAIKLRKIKFAAIGSFSRMITMFVLSFFVPNLLEIINPKYLPGMFLIFIGIVETFIYVFGIVKITKGKIKTHLIFALREQNTYSENSSISYKQLIIFGIPLMISALIAQFLPNFTQSALALSEYKITILAVYTISISIIFIFAGVSFQIPQLIVNHNCFDKDSRVLIIKFCNHVVIITTILLALVAFTPIGTFVFRNLLYVSESSTEIAKLSCAFGILIPASSVYEAYKRGKLLKIRKTSTLIFQRLIGALLPYVLIFIIPIIEWKYAAPIGIFMFSLSNFTAGIFSSIVFRFYVKKDPEIINQIF